MDDKLTPTEMAELGLAPANPNSNPMVPTQVDGSSLTTEEKADLGVANKGELPAATNRGEFSLSGYVADRVKLLGEHYNMGDRDMMEGVAFAPAALGLAEFDEVNTRLSDEKVEAMQKQKMKLLEQAVPTNDLVRFMLPAFDSLAYTKRLFEVGSVGSIVGGGLGAAAGAATGAAAAAPTGELAAPATIPAGIVGGASLGATLGGTAATFTAASYVSMGQTYKRLRLAKVPHERASQLAVANGVVQGGIEAAQTALLGQIGKTAFSPVLKTAGGKKLVENALLQYFKLIGLEGLEEGTQEIAGLLIDDWSQSPEIKPKKEDYWNKFISSTITGMQAATVLGAGMAAGGKAARVAGDKIADSKLPAILDNRTLVQSVKFIIQSKRAAEAEAKQQRDEEIAKMKVEAKLAEPPKKVDVSEALAEEKKPTPEKKDTLEQAEEKRKHLRQMEKDLLKEVGDHVVKGEDVPAQLRKDLADVRREIRKVVRRKQEVITQQRRAELEKNYTDKGITAQQEGELAEQIAAVDKELRQIKADAASEELNDSIKVVDQEISEREQELSQREDNDTLDPYKSEISLVMDLENLKEQRENLVMQQEALDQGLMSAADIEALNTVAPANKRRAIIGSVLQNALDLIKSSKNLTSDSISKNYKLMKDFITRSGLSLHDQGRILKLLDIKKFKNAEATQKALPTLNMQVSELLAADQHRRAKARLDKAVASTEAGRRNDRPQSKFTADVQKTLDRVREFVENPAAAVDAYLNAETDQAAEEDRVLASRVLNLGGQHLAAEVAELTDQLADLRASKIVVPKGTKLSPDEREERREINKAIAKTAMDLRKANAAWKAQAAQHMNTLAGRISKIAKAGRDARVAQKTKEMESLREFHEETLDQIDSNWRETTSHPAASINRVLPGFTNKSTKFMRTLGKDHFSWEGKLRIVMQDAKNPTQAVEKLNRLVVDAVRKSESQKRQQMEVLMQHLVDKSGMKRSAILKQMARGAKQKITLRYVNSEGYSDTAHLTRNEAIQLYMQMQDESLRRGLRNGNKYSFNRNTFQSTERVLEDALSPEEKALADGLLSFYRDQYNRLNEEYERATGLQLDFNKFYSGIAYREGFNENDINSEFETQLEAMTKFRSLSANTPNNTVARLDSVLPLAPKDAFTNAFQSIALVEHYRAWRSPSKTLAFVFDNSVTRQAIGAKFGTDMYTALKAHITDMTQGAVQREYAFSNIVHTVLRNYGDALLALKPLQYIKQWTSIANFLLHINEKELVEGVADYFENKKFADEVLNSSELFKVRYANFDLQKAGALMNDSIQRSQQRTFRDAMLLALRLGDEHVVLAGGWAVYKATLKKTGDPEKAMRAFEDAFNTTQSSGTIDQLSNFSRDKYTKVLAIFTQQPTRMWEFEVNAWRDAVNNPSLPSFYNAMHTSAVTHVSQALYGLVAVFWTYLITNDDDEREKAIWSWAMDTLKISLPPTISDAVSVLATTARNVTTKGKDYPVFDMINIPPYEAINNTGRLFKDILEGFVKGDWGTERMLKIMLDYARSVNLLLPGAAGGIPIEPPLKLLKQFFVKPKKHVHIDLV